jgi:hypothetical protein
MEFECYFNVYKTQTPALVHVWARRINFTPFLLTSNKVKVKVKQSHYKSGQALRFPGR